MMEATHPDDSLRQSCKKRVQMDPLLTLYLVDLTSLTIPTKAQDEYSSPSDTQLQESREEDRKPSWSSPPSSA